MHPKTFEQHQANALYKKLLVDGFIESPYRGKMKALCQKLDNEHIKYRIETTAIHIISPVHDNLSYIAGRIKKKRITHDEGKRLWNDWVAMVLRGQQTGDPYFNTLACSDEDFLRYDSLWTKKLTRDEILQEVHSLFGTEYYITPFHHSQVNVETYTKRITIRGPGLNVQMNPMRNNELFLDVFVNFSD